MDRRPRIWVSLLLVAACSRGPGSAPEQAEPFPRTALTDVAEGLLADRLAPRHPSDGGGRATRTGGDDPIPIQTPGSWSFDFEVGPEGIQRGGALYFQVSPFWGWTTPQVLDERRPGFTRVTTAADGVELQPRTVDQQLLYVGIEGRNLLPEERISIEYGLGIGARSDRNAEEDSRFYFAVDGDGDGVRELTPHDPSVDVVPGPCRRLAASLTSTARPGDRARLTVAALDAVADAGCDLAGTVALSLVSGDPDGIALPERIELGAHARTTVELETRLPGVYRIRAGMEIDGEQVSADSNPLRVDERAPRVLWGDLHGHSGRSDGTGTPRAYYDFARNVAALDFAALTDHDHFGMRALDKYPQFWAEITEVVAAFDEPGRFSALLGFEWTSWIHGHRHVVYFEDGGEVLSSLDERTDTPQELWAALRGRAVLTIPHHPAGGPIAIDWNTPPDPELEPLVEVVSAHGSSESADAPSRIYNFRRGASVRDAIEYGYRLGFIGSGDSHDGHPGYTHLDPQYGYLDRGGGEPPTLGNGGLVAVFCEELGREALLGALRQRATYATNGPRILLSAELEGRRMGSFVAASDLPEHPRVAVEVHATAPVSSIDLVLPGEVVRSLPEAPELDLSVVLGTRELRAGEFVYVRVLQVDGGSALSSPVYVE